MTPHQTAMRFMRQRDTTVSHPDFIVAYLLAEAKAAGFSDLRYLSDHPSDRQQAAWRTLSRSFQVMAKAFKKSFSILARAQAGTQSDFVKSA